MSRLIAITRVKIEKMSWVCGPLNFLPKSSPISNPPNAASANGAATNILRLPEAAEKIAPPPVTMARTPSEVAAIDLIGKSV